MNQKNVLSTYQVRVAVDAYKNSEFIEFCHSIFDEFRKEIGFRNLNIYQDVERSNIYVMVCEWESQETRENHLRGDGFSLLKGGAIVLGKNFKLIIDETTTTEYSQWKRLKLPWQTN